MNSLVWLLFMVGIGKIFILLWMSFPIPLWMENNQILKKLHSCDLCSGFYVFGFLFLIYGIDLLPLLGITRVPYVGEVITGGIITFVAHIFELGWKSKFESFYIE